MRQSIKKATGVVLTASMLLTAIPYPVFAESPGVSTSVWQESGSREGATGRETAVSEEINYEGKTPTQKYQTAEGTVHTIYWLKGLTPPKMSGKASPENAGRYGDFTRSDISGFVTYETPYEENRGYFDMNKENNMSLHGTSHPDNRCYLAAATNMLYWWMSQNKDYIDPYMRDLQKKEQFQMPEGLAGTPTLERWQELSHAPEPKLEQNRWIQYLDDSALVKEGGPFAPYYSNRLDGFYDDLVMDFMINGYKAVSGENPDPNRPEDYTMDPEGGFFYPIFGTKLLTERYRSTSYHLYNQNLKKWIQEGNGLSISYLKGAGNSAHAITIWGAEYDESDNLVRLYITDSDDYDNVVDGKACGIHSFNVKNNQGTMLLGNNPRPNIGVKVNTVTRLKLGREEWERAFSDANRKPEAAVIQKQPVGRTYGIKASADPLTIDAVFSKADQGKTASLHYQWYQAEGKEAQGKPIAGATKASYTPIISAGEHKEFYYCVVTTQKYGFETSVKSEAAEIITTNEAAVDAQKPVLQNLTGGVVQQYTAGDTATALEVRATIQDEGTLSYQWYRAKDSGTYNDQNPIKNATGKSFTPPVSEPGNGFYYCIVTNTNPKATGRSKASVRTAIVTIRVSEATDLSITNLPKNPVYLDQFRLKAIGPSGDLSWKVTEGADVAEIREDGTVTVTGVGTFTVTATLTRADGPTLTKSVSLTANKKKPEIGSVTLTGSVYPGTSKKDAEKNLHRSDESLPGTLSFREDPSKLPVGNHSVPWVFTPKDTAHYETVSGSVTLTIRKDSVTGLSVSGTPKQTEYTEGEAFQPEGLAFWLLYQSGKREPVEAEKLTFSALKSGMTSVTATYRDQDQKEVSVTINGIVVKNAAEPEIPGGGGNVPPVIPEGPSGGGGGGGGGFFPIMPETSATVTTPDKTMKPEVHPVDSSLIHRVKKYLKDSRTTRVIGGSECGVEITAARDGHAITNFKEPVLITLPVSESVFGSVKDRSHLTFAQVIRKPDGSTELSYIGGRYDEKAGIFTAKADNAGYYVLVEKDNLIKITMTIDEKETSRNDKPVMNDVAPIIVDSRTMVPLRYIGESLGCRVDWNGKTRTITIKKQETTLTMTVDRKIPGFDASPIIRDDRTLVPIRYVSEALGANVIYAPAERQVIITQ